MKSMKTFLIAPLLAISAMFAISCSKQQVNQTKLEVSDKVSAAVEKVLVKQYSGPEYENLACETEAVKVANKVGLKVDELLKADRPEESTFARKSVGSDLIQMGCKLVLSKAIPLVLSNRLESYPCASLALGDGLDSLSSKACEGIEL